jgi:hypothetical protein
LTTNDCTTPSLICESFDFFNHSGHSHVAIVKESPSAKGPLYAIVLAAYEHVFGGAIVAQASTHLYHQALALGTVCKSVIGSHSKMGQEKAMVSMFWKSAQIMTSRYLGKELRLTGRKATQLTLHFRFHVSLVRNRLLTRHEVYYNPL